MSISDKKPDYVGVYVKPTAYDLGKCRVMENTNMYDERLVATINAKNVQEALASLEMLLDIVKKLGPKFDGPVDKFIIVKDPKNN